MFWAFYKAAMDNDINFQHCSGGRATIRSLTPINMGVRRSTQCRIVDRYKSRTPGRGTAQNVIAG